MGYRIVAALCALAPLGSVQSQAATIVNQDAIARRVTIVVADQRDTREIGPGRSLEDVCTSGCILRIEGERDADYELDGREIVSIEGGKLMFDREVSPTPAETPATPKP